MLVLFAALIAVSLGMLVFKLTVRLFVLSIRLILFGATALFVFVPIMFAMALL